MTKGCLAGSAVCFVSHKGVGLSCGYLPVEAGNGGGARGSKMFWENAEVFKKPATLENLEGKRYLVSIKIRSVFGCRARAFYDRGKLSGRGAVLHISAQKWLKRYKEYLRVKT